jgi:hypothetical protein
MKKALLIGSLGVFGVLALASCKKDYTCDCTINGATVSSQIKDAKKKDAQSECDALGVSASLAGGSCSLGE